MSGKDFWLRFWSKVSIVGECWEWTAAKIPDGYGVFGVDGISRCAHRISWEFFHGQIPHSLYVLHRCDNPPCVNPSHLFIGSQKDNVSDCTSKGRRGIHRPSAETNGMVKLNRWDIPVIRHLVHQHKFKQSVVASLYSVSRSAINSIILNNSWVSV